MRKVTLFSWAAVCSLVATAGAACAGKSTSGSIPDPTSPSDAGIGPRPTDCPTSLPAQGASCTKEALLCEYGDDYNPTCNDVVVCSGGRWATPFYRGGGGSRTCPSTPPTLPPNPQGCAPTAAEVPAGQACSPKGLTCTYDGALCSCGAFCPSYPVGQADCNPDAGITQNCCDRTNVRWTCFRGPAYCATPRPRVGQACTREGERCAIDAPRECGQTSMECRQGVWNVAPGECPISSARFKRDVAYVSQPDAEQLRGDLMRVKVARYRYTKGDDAPHLGFIIEDMPEGSPAVLPSRDRVDLYGYVSMTVVALQQQNEEIARLRAEVARLSDERRATSCGGR
jgi:hypothetical protein